MRYAFVVVLLLAPPALARNAAPREGTITCSSPVAPEDSAKSLMQRYGQEAVIQADLRVAEDITYKGVVLLPRASDRRIEVRFTDDTLSRVAALTLRDVARTSRWNVVGITIGSTLAEVEKVNGKPFLVNGFEWDYGGLVTDWNGGRLGRPLQGGCTVRLRFDKYDAAPDGMVGDGVKVSSANPTLRKWGPVVTEIGVNFPGT